MTTKVLEAHWKNGDGGSASLTMPSEFAWQDLLRIENSNGWTIKSHSNGDQYITHPNPGAAGELRFVMDIKEMTFEDVMATPADAKPGARYLGSDSIVDVTNSELKAEGLALRQATDTNGDVNRLSIREEWALAEACLEKASELSYRSMSSNQGSNYAMQYDAGDCTEFAAKFAGLLRVNGIPAGVQNNFWSGNDGIQGPNSSPTHHDTWLFLRDKDGNRDGVTGEGHIFTADANTHDGPYGYGWGQINDTKIHMGKYGDNVWGWSGLTDLDFYVEFG